jgi:hypothetical protein
MMVLGAGESGKSTLFNHLRQVDSIVCSSASTLFLPVAQLYVGGFSDAERRNVISVIYANIITAMKTLHSQCAARPGLE